MRDTHGIDAKNPLPFFAVKQRIEAALSAYAGRFVVVALPNITNVFYGRDVGRGDICHKAASTGRAPRRDTVNANLRTTVYSSNLLTAATSCEVPH